MTPCECVLHVCIIWIYNHVNTIAFHQEVPKMDEKWHLPEEQWTIMRKIQQWRLCDPWWNRWPKLCHGGMRRTMGQRGTNISCFLGDGTWTSTSGCSMKRYVTCDPHNMKNTANCSLQLTKITEHLFWCLFQHNEQCFHVVKLKSCLAGCVFVHFFSYNWFFKFNTCSNTNTHTTCVPHNGKKCGNALNVRRGNGCACTSILW